MPSPINPRRFMACVTRMICVSCVVGGICLPSMALAQDPAQPAPSIAELRSLCRNMAKDHISAGARQRASQFLLGSSERIWRDSTGAYQTLAAYHRHDVAADGKVMVTLRKSDGQLVQIDRDRLSAPDQTLVSQLSHILGRLGEDAETYRDYLREKLDRRVESVERYSTALPYSSSSAGYAISSGYPDLGVSVGWAYPYSVYTNYPYYGGTYFGRTVYSPAWPYGYGYGNGFGYSNYSNHSYPYRYGTGRRPSRPSRPRPGGGSGGGGGGGGPAKGPRSPYTGGDVYGF